MSKCKGSLCRRNLERCPYSRGDPVVQPAATQESSRGSWAAHYLWGKITDSSHALFLGMCWIGPQLLNWLSAISSFNPPDLCSLICLRVLSVLVGGEHTITSLSCDVIFLSAAFMCTSSLVFQILPPMQFSFWGEKVKVLELLSEADLSLTTPVQDILANEQQCTVHNAGSCPAWGCPEFCTMQNCDQWGLSLSA